MDEQRLISLTLITEELKINPLTNQVHPHQQLISVCDILHPQVTFKSCGWTFNTWLESIDPDGPDGLCAQVSWHGPPHCTTHQQILKIYSL